MDDATRYLHFIYTPTFEADAKGLLTEDDRHALEDALLANPRVGVVMPGTGGFRKMRFALPGRGKSGGARVVYFYIARRGRVYFVTAFPENQRENLTKAERNELREIAKELEREAMSKIGERILKGAREARQIHRGEMAPARESRRKITAREATVAPPPRFDAARIRRTRERMGMSQPVFADALNVSASTVRAWERGARQPQGPSRRLLELAERAPEAFTATVRRGAA